MKQILVFDDNIYDADLIARELIQSGYDFDVVRVEDVQHLKTLFHQNPDLLIVDLHMPQTNAFDVINLARAAKFEGPIIVVSGLVREHESTHLRQCGAADVLSKSQLAMLPDAVNRALEEHHLQKSYRLSEGYLNAAFGALVEGVVIADRSGRIIHKNKSAIRFLELLLSGLDTGNLFVPWEGMTSDGIALASRDNVAKQAFDQNEIMESLIQVKRAGQSHWFTVRAVPGAFNTMTPDLVDGVVVSFSDITERRKLEEQLELIRRLDTLGKLVAGVAHDFNNILMVVQTNAGLIQERLDKDDVENREDIGEILTAGERAIALVRQLLTFSKRGVSKTVTVDLNQAIRDIAKMLKRIVGEHIDVEYQLAEDVWPVRIDLGQLEQVLINLLTNARDAMPGGGKIIISTCNKVFDDDYLTNRQGAVPGEYASFSVTDNGTGINPENMGQIFEPFFTTNRERDGTGIGLSTCYGIIKQARGNIWAYSEPGIGTTFKVYLPRAFEGNEKAPRQVNRDRRINAQGKRILVVEDQENTLFAIQRLLDDLGFQVLAFPSPDQAIDHLSRHNVFPDLILTDVVLPGLSGKEMIERLSAEKRDAPTIFMSGYPDAAVRQHGIVSADDHFIQKPFTRLELTKMIRQALESE